MKKLISLALSCMMLAVMGSSTLVYAEDGVPTAVWDEGVSTYGQYHDDVTATLTISSSGNARCTSTVSGKTTMTKVVVTQTLQMRDGPWRTASSWNKTFYTQDVSYTNTYDIVSASGVFRTETKAVVYSGTASETVYDYSDIVYYNTTP